MRALLIDAEGIKEVDYDGTLENMYRLMDCRLVTGAGYPDDKHACWADDEGLFHMGPGSLYTRTTWTDQDLIGSLLITGFDIETGETIGATMGIDELLQMVEVHILDDRKNLH